MESSSDSRPLSPHLSIYRPQITSMLSILHRITGVWLFLGLFALTWWLVYDVTILQRNVLASCDCISAWVLKALLLSWTGALYYHLLNGIRHLFWDIGKGFEIQTVTKSGIAVVTGAALLTAVSWFIALS